MCLGPMPPDASDFPGGIPAFDMHAQMSMILYTKIRYHNDYMHAKYLSDQNRTPISINCSADVMKIDGVK